MSLAQNIKLSLPKNHMSEEAVLLTVCSTHEYYDLCEGQPLRTWKTFTLIHSLLSLDMLNNFCFHVYDQKSLSHSQTLALSLSHTLFKSLIHAEQLLFSCLCSKLTLTLSHSHSLSLTLFLTLSLTLFQSLIQSLLTCWTGFVFISMHKSCCL